ncbi:MAG TPA: glycosyltransferase family 39 protein [Nannocystaceae bacterium]|nr:glycosyltransferase family 39 protein [Nannocystaceae bacterium]
MDRAPRLDRLRAWLWQERWAIAIFVAALLVRLHWNLSTHPLGDYIYSDMNGYNSRAERMVREPFGHYEYQAFFPFGTHALIAGFKAIFGMQNFVAIGIGYALMGAIAVTMAFTIARRVSSYRIVPPAVGLLCIFYYPHLSIGGYMLSELPFSTFMIAAIWYSLRLLDEGKHRHAVLMGLFAGLAALCRPQVLMAVGVLGLFWIWRRTSLPKIRLVHLLVAGIPLAILLSLSAFHFRWMTGRTGLVSENGPFNMVFGRCHNSKIESLPDGKGHGKVHFRPPEFLQLNNLLDKKKKEGVEPPIKLDPIIGDVLNYKGYIGDRDRHNAYIKECLQKTTIWRQIQYSYTNVILLWRYNVPWPDSGRGQWREPARLWSRFHEIALAIPSLFFLVTLFRKRWVRQGWLALHLFAVLVVAALYFGGTRHRASYDPLLIFFAFEVYAAVGWWLWLRWQKWRDKKHLGTE